MGRNAHVLRLALGRNADQPPDWPLLRRQYLALERDNVQEQGVYRGIDITNEASFGRCFNDKGQPIDRQARDLDRARCEAQNTVVSIALPAADRPGAGLQTQSTQSMVNEADWVAARRIFHAVDECSVAWLVSFRSRLSMLRSLNRAPTIFQALESELHTLGAFHVFTAGCLCTLLDSSSLDGSLQEKLVQVCSLHLPGIRWSSATSAIIESCLSFSVVILQGAIVTAAHIQALHISPSATPENRFPWFRILRSCSPRQLFTGFAYVLLPAWLLCNLQLQARVFVQSLLREEFGPPLSDGHYHYFEWISQDSKRQSLIDERAEEAPVNPSMPSLRGLLWRTRSVIRRASRSLVYLLGLSKWPGESNPLSSRHSFVKSVSLLPTSFALNIFPELCRQMLASPINGILSRSLAWLFLQHRSPFQLEGLQISRADLYPVLPTLADFTPGLGLGSTMSYVGRLGLTFFLQCGVSMALVGIKSALVLAVLKARVDEMAAQTESKRAVDPLGID